MISVIGRQITVVAVPFQVYQATHSTGLIGLLGLVQAVPLIGCALVAGAITDRFDRRITLLAAQLVLGVASGGLLLVALAADRYLPVVFALVALQAAATAVESPARSSIIPRLVPPSALASAMSLNFGMFTVALVVGPTIGGLLVGHAGVATAYAADVVTFVAAVVAVILLPPQPPALTEHEPTLAAIRTGLRFVRHQQVILGGFAADLAAMVFGMPRAVFPALAATILHTDASGLGLLYAAVGIGAFLGVVGTGWVGRTQRQGRAVVAAIVVWSLSIVGVGLVSSLGAALVLLAVAGAADSLSAVCRSTMIQELTPDSVRGRTNALYSMVVRSGPFLGDIEAGLVGQAFGVEVAIVSGGLLSLLGVGAAIAAYPAFWRYRARHAPPSDP